MEKVKRNKRKDKVQKTFARNLKENKAITLIALVITIIVLLILAGVAISQLTGSESAMEKAAEAREKDKQGTELEAIKLAVVNSAASGLDGLVNAENLKEGLNGIVEDEGRLKIKNDNAPWIVTGKTGMKYKINQNGEVTSAESVSSVEFVSNTEKIAVSKSKKLSIIAKGASGNITEANEVTFVSSNEDIATVEEDGSIKIVDDESKIGQTVNISVIADGINGSNECTITVVELILPKIGDFVNYSAGNWTVDEISALTSAELYAGPSMPTALTPFKFGGFALGDSKDESRTPYETYVNTYSGWRVSSLNTDGTIKEIIHAGTPEGYFHPESKNNAYKSQKILGGGIHESAPSTDPSDATKSFESIVERNWDMYATGRYGVSARLATNSEIGYRYSETILAKTGAYYWIPKVEPYGSLYNVSEKGRVRYGNYANKCFGIRPVVILESGVKGVEVDESHKTHTTPETAWNLSK